MKTLITDDFAERPKPNVVLPPNTLTTGAQLNVVVEGEWTLMSAYKPLGRNASWTVTYTPLGGGNGNGA